VIEPRVDTGQPRVVCSPRRAATGLRRRGHIAVAVIATLRATGALAQPIDEPALEPPAGEPVIAAPALVSPRVEIHGFASEGAFAETTNDYFGSTSHASLELFEAGLNVSTDIADRLRAGIQLFARDFGSIRDASPRIDWAFLDYRWRRWLGLRAGIIKMPFGLYNEYVDIDAARLPILLPSSVYPIRNRDVLISHTGFSLYGSRSLGTAGELDYQAWLGTLTIPRTALQLSAGASLESVNTKYVTGGQLFWHPPVDGLRVGATALRTSIDFHIAFDANLVSQLVMAGLVPASFDGRVVISQRPVSLAIGSVEYARNDWLFAAEYSRSLTRQRSSLPTLLPTFERESEAFYLIATHRIAPALEVGAYYSVFNNDVDDMPPMYVRPYDAFQRDLAATVRLDINDHWLWKLEGHFMDGAASLPIEFNINPERYWGVFLLRTTVTF
jgi:hypothetical protein